MGSVLALAENNFALFKSILDDNQTVEHVLFAGGSPCQGFSRASSNPRGVGDDRSALIWVLLSLPKAAAAHLGSKAEVAAVFENVVTYATNIQDNIAKLLGVEPQVVNASLCAACDRDRNFWSSYPSVPTPGFGSVEPEISKVLKQGGILGIGGRHLEGKVFDLPQAFPARDSFGERRQVLEVPLPQLHRAGARLPA